jgi:hypothetical protein
MVYDPVIAGQHVERFMNDEVIQQVFRERKLLYFEQWLAAPDAAAREQIYAEARAFSALGTALQAVVNAGVAELAQKDLERRSE